MNQNYHGNRTAGYSRNQMQESIKIDYPSLDSKELLGDDAYKLAKDIMDKCKNSKNKNDKLTKTQIRRFYSEVKNIERTLPEDVKTIDDSVYGRIKLIKAKAAYSTARKSSKLPEPFSDFIGHYIDEIKISEGYEKAFKNFKKFCKLFEAFVGYSYGMGLPD